MHQMKTRCCLPCNFLYVAGVRRGQNLGQTLGKIVGCQGSTVLGKFVTKRNSVAGPPSLCDLGWEPIHPLHWHIVQLVETWARVLKLPLEIKEFFSSLLVNLRSVPGFPTSPDLSSKNTEFFRDFFQNSYVSSLFTLELCTHCTLRRVCFSAQFGESNCAGGGAYFLCTCVCTTYIWTCLCPYCMRWLR